MRGSEGEIRSGSGSAPPTAGAGGFEDALALLDAVETWVEERRVRERQIFTAAAAFADMFSEDAAPPGTGPGRLRGAGREQARRYGGAGTPKVLEFAPARLAMRTDQAPHGAARLIADALDARHRLSRIWARVCAGEALVHYVRKVAAATRHLTVEAAGFVDAAMVLCVDGRLPWSRFCSRLEGKVVAADPELAAAAEEQARRDQFVRVGQTNEHGIKTLYVRALARDVIHFDATVHALTEALAFFGDPDPEHLRQARAIGIMANPLLVLKILTAYARAHQPTATEPAPESQPEEPERPEEPEEPAVRPCPACQQPAVSGDPAPFLRPELDLTGLNPSALAPRVTLYVHLAEDTLRSGTGVARWEGEGPVTAEYVRAFLGPGARFTIKPVIDLNHMAPADAYEVPARLREAVLLRSPADTFPHAGSLSRAKDLDHPEPWVPPDKGGPPGQTRMDNLQPLGRFHHRIKTHAAGWSCKQPFNGILIWRSPDGDHYLVDHTGTRKLGRFPST